MKTGSRDSDKMELIQGSESDKLYNFSEIVRKWGGEF